MTANEFLIEITKTGIQHKISGKTITEQINIETNLAATGIIIENCIFEESVFMEGIDLNFGIKIIGCKFKKTLSFNNCIANKYDLTYNFDGYHLDFKSTTK